MRAPLATQLNIATNCRNRRDRKPDDFFWSAGLGQWAIGCRPRDLMST